MNKIKINDLNKQIVVVDRLINEYEDVLLNLFHQLKESCMNWQDGNSKLFEEKIFSEKLESNVMFNKLCDYNYIYTFIYDNYKNLGKKIEFNLNNKMSLINNYNSIIDEFVDILNEFDNIDNSFYYSEYNKIKNLKYSLMNEKYTFINLKNNIIQILDNIDIIEKEVSSKISKLNNIDVKEFNFVFNTGALNVNNCILNEILLQDNIDRIFDYGVEKENLLKKIITELFDNNNNYVTSNQINLKASINDYNNINKKSNEKIEKYIDVLKKAIVIYNENQINTINYFDNK